MLPQSEISEASRKYNAQDSVKALKSMFFELYKDEDSLDDQQQSKKMWMNPSHVQKMVDYVHTHKEVIAKSPAHARRFSRSTSLLHLEFKKGMIAHGIQGFETEQELDFYSVDELNRDLKIALEVDGCYWHGCQECGFEGIPGIKRIDKSKETFLINAGWQVVRIKEHDIKKDLKSCLDRVANTVKERTPRGQE